MEQFLTGNFKIGQLFGFSYVCEETVTWDSGELFFSGGREKGDSLAMLKPPRLQKKAEFELQFPEDNLDVNFGEVGSSVSVDMDRRWQSGSRLDMDRPRPKELPFDIWRIIIDNVESTSTLSRLCQVSSWLHYFALPKLYTSITIIYLSPTQYALSPYNAEANRIHSELAPFTYHPRFDTAYVQYVKNVTIKELRASEGPEGGSDTSLARRTDRALNHRSISPAQPSPWLGDLVRKMARLETINWQSVNPSLQKAIFDALCDRCKPMADGRERKNKLRSFNLSKLPTPFPSIARARGARHYEHQDWSIEFFHGLESLRLHDVCNADVVKRIGNYLRSPAGNVIKEVKLGCMAPYTSPDSLEVLFTGTKEPNTQTVQLDTLQLSRFYCGYQFGLDSYLDTANLKVLRLINCNAKEALRGPDKTPIKFPNLKTFHIGGKYDLMPDVFDALPVLEELCIPVECRFEREFGGTINNFLVRNGKGLKRLYLDFVRRPRTWLEELTPKDWGRYEIDWMLLVAETCVNLEELGLRGAVTKAKQLWGMALPVAGGFPNLRSLSIDPNSSPVIRTDSIVAGYMATSEDILGVVLQALERRLQSRNRNSIKNIYNIEYIKIMRNVWRLNIMDSESSNRVSAEKLKRADLLAMEIPPLFLIEEIEGRASIWDEVEGRS